MRSIFLAEPATTGTLRVWRWLLPLLVLSFAFWLVPWAHTCGLGCVPGDIGDARFNDVVLEHFYRWVIGQDRSLLSPPFFYPMPGALTFSDNHWGTAWLYSLFRALGSDRYRAFDLWYLTAYIVNYLVCYWVLCKLRFSPIASAIGAFAFTFPMPVIAKYGHAQLLYRFLVPLALLCWQRFSESGSWRWIGWLSLAVVSQFYMSIYLGYFTVLFLVAWIVAQWRIDGWGPRGWFHQWYVWKQPAARKDLIAAGLMVVLAVAAFAFLMHPYLHYAKLYGFRRVPEEIATMLPRPQSYLLADGSSIWSGLSAKYITVPMRGEHQMFFGVGMLGLVLFAIFRSPQRLRWIAGISIVLLVLLTLSTGKHPLYMYLAELPGVDSIRAVSRIGLIMTLPIAMLVAMAVDAVRAAGVASRTLVLVLILFMGTESIATRTVSFNITEAHARTAQMIGQLPSPLAADAILFNPSRPDAAFFVTELDGVVLAQEVGRPTLNGYSGNSPPGYDSRGNDYPCMQATMRLEAAEAFYANHLMHAEPKGASGPLVIVGGPACSKDVWREMPLEDSGKVSIRIESLQKVGSEYRVLVTVHNGSSHALNTTGTRANPLHLSWQKLGERSTVDPMGWVARAEIDGPGAILPGESRIVSFVVPVASDDAGKLAVSAVFEGRGWLQDHGFYPAFGELPAR